MSKRKQLTIQQRQKQVITRLKKTNNDLRLRVSELEKQIKIKDKALEHVLIRLAELEEMIFGKKTKKEKDKDDKENDIDDYSGGSTKVKRDKSSYVRKTPSDEDVTNTEKYSIDNCPECKTKLTKKQIVVRYIEDIHLACTSAIDKDIDIKVKKVTKQIIEKGYCPRCKKWHSAILISNKITRAGPNVKMFVAYSINILRLSYEQTKNMLADLYRFNISDGEIAIMLKKIAQALKPEFACLKQRILKAKSVHLDETGWKTQGEKNYNWIMASGETEEALFLIGKSRGKGHAENLLEDYTGVRVTDCYPAYKNMKGEQAVCWAHIIRKARDLKNNSNLKKHKRGFAIIIYKEISELFKKISNVHKTDFHQAERMKALPRLEVELDNIVKKILKKPNQSVKKLTDLAKQMNTYKKQLFTCVTTEGVDTTNNKAERKLRHLVLKRKNCFGTKTENGNQIMEVNMSVLLSLWWSNRDQFFPKFQELMAG